MTYFIPESKQDLNDAGTRFKHYTELLELWKTGEEILDTICDRPYVTEQDQINLERIRIAVALLEEQINILSNYSIKKWDMREEIDSIGNPS